MPEDYYYSGEVCRSDSAKPAKPLAVDLPLAFRKWRHGEMSDMLGHRDWLK
jgi:hypothetical protein